MDGGERGEAGGGGFRSVFAEILLMVNDGRAGGKKCRGCLTSLQFCYLLEKQFPDECTKSLDKIK